MLMPSLKNVQLFRTKFGTDDSKSGAKNTKRLSGTKMTKCRNKYENDVRIKYNAISLKRKTERGIYVWYRQRTTGFEKRKRTEWKMCGGMFEMLPAEFSIRDHGIFQCTNFLHTRIFPMVHPRSARQYRYTLGYKTTTVYCAFGSKVLITIELL
jgi:hypothetical protein